MNTDSATPATSPRDTADREFDLVLVGATGFVGRLTAEHLARHAPGDLRIALAGRSRDRLTQARRGLPEAAADWPLVVVDTLDHDAVRELAERTRVVVTTVGPYTAFGRPLLGACAAAGTHYADLTGEVLFVREMIDAHHATAQATGARIVTSCGFDSVPSDLGVLLTAQRAAADDAGTLTDTTLRVRSARGGFSGGTIDSMRRQFAEAAHDAERAAVVNDPYGLSPDRDAEPDRRGDGRRGRRGRLPVAKDATSGRWEAPFVMAGYNTRVVRRSNALNGWAYGRDFRYREVTDTGAGLAGLVRAAGLTAVLGSVAGGMRFAPTRALLNRALPQPGEGPSAETMANGRFVMDIDATTTTGARYTTRVAADKDPGYTGTAVMLGEAGISLAVDEERLPARAGVLTPATALGEVLVERLRSHGFTLDTRRR
ncbi:MAG: saccharopine dehydrogenase NADP-binding domain-containing protein [Micrococcus sp.]|nr:saccharopine dehydrogenase NADP-binding domain-containing protein [Micrococcus sp.]